ncbi:hypothetical protein SK128_022308 [Halocaridina rubra]|uniref:Uncharacterized protein n=1 Tax=Halocaridina rubra TaxID=373956 RepID=A0AAN8WZ77_HALRR
MLALTSSESNTRAFAKDTNTLLGDRPAPTTPEGLWRAFLQGSHHHHQSHLHHHSTAIASHHQKVEQLDLPLSPESPRLSGAMVTSSDGSSGGGGGRGRGRPHSTATTNSPSPPPPLLTTACQHNGELANT